MPSSSRSCLRFMPFALFALGVYNTAWLKQQNINYTRTREQVKAQLVAVDLRSRCDTGWVGPSQPARHRPGTQALSV